MSSRPPRRSSGGFHAGSSGPADDSPAQTNLGLLLQRALEAAQQQGAQTADTEESAGAEAVVQAREAKLCADCWNALTFKDEGGRQMARCAKDLWVRAAFTYEELNANRIRRWYADCPAYDDSE